VKALEARRPQHRGPPTDRFGSCYLIHIAAGSHTGYRSCVSNGGRAVAASVEASADVAQAHVFHALLSQRRAALCDRLDQQAVTLARHERGRDSAGVRRKRLRIKEIGAEIRDIDRMVQRLTVHLLREAQKQRP
jgi:hypothetical protein